MLRWLCIVLALSASLSIQAIAAERLYLLERGPRDVLVANPATGEVIQKLPLTAEPEQMFATPDGRRVVILNRASTGPASITIIDTAATKVLGTVEVGWGVPDETTGRTTSAFGTFAELHWWGPAGTILLDEGTRLLVVSPGTDASHPPELVVVDLEHATVSGRVPSPARGTRQVGSTTIRSNIMSRPDHSPIVVFNPSLQQKGESLPAELTFVDLTKQEVAGSVRLSGKPSQVAWPRGSGLIYVLEPATTPETAGHLHLVATADRSIKQSLDVSGATALSMTKDNELFLLGPATVARADQTMTRGEIRALRGEALGEPVSVLSYPRAVRSTPDHKRLAVICGRGVSVVDRESQKVIGDVTLDGQLAHFVLVGEGTRALALLYDPDSHVGSLAILDLARPARVATVQAGSAGKAFGLSVLGGVAAGAFAAMTDPVNPGLARGYAETRYLSQWGAEQSADLVVSPDERHAWVLNTSTQDLFNIDLESAQVSEKMGVAVNETLHRFHDLLLLTETSAFRAIDMRSGKKLPRTLTMSGVYMSPVPSPSGAWLGVMFHNAVFVLDGTTGNQVAKVAGKKLAGALLVPVTP